MSEGQNSPITTSKNHILFGVCFAILAGFEFLSFGDSGQFLGTFLADRWINFIFDAIIAAILVYAIPAIRDRVNANDSRAEKPRRLWAFAIIGILAIIVIAVIVKGVL